MRLKVLLSAFGLAAAIIAAALWFSGPSQTTVNNISESGPGPAAPRAAARHPAPAIQSLLAVNTFYDAAPARPKLPDDAAAIAASLNSSDFSTRKTALQQARDSDDRSLIPALRELAAQTDGEEERGDILDTIKFLELPSITEDMAAAQAARASAGLSEPARAPLNRWTGLPLGRKD